MHLTSPKLLITEKSVPFQFTRLRHKIFQLWKIVLEKHIQHTYKWFLAWNFVSTTSHRLCKKLIWVPKIRISKKKAVSEAHFGSIYLHFLPPSPLCNHKSVINNIKGRARNVMLKRKHMAALLETGKFFQDRLYVNCIIVSFYYTLSTERI